MDDNREPPSEKDPDPACSVPLLGQLFETLWLPKGQSQDALDERLQAAIDQVKNIRPTGAIEEMLAVQMIATHEAAMECLRRAAITGQGFAGRDMNLKHAAKFLAIYERQVAALDKHRGKGQQSVTVKHVHVGEGGQAIVGNVTHGAGKSAREPATRQALEPPSEQPMEIFLPADKPLSTAKSTVSKGEDGPDGRPKRRRPR